MITTFSSPNEDSHTDLFLMRDVKSHKSRYFTKHKGYGMNNLKLDSYPPLQDELSKTKERDHLGGTTNYKLSFLNTKKRSFFSWKS